MIAGKEIPIPSYIKDPHYRYKMPVMELKIEGRGNGIKTNVLNMQEVAEALKCKTDYPLKFMGYALGAPMTFEKKDGRDNCILNGEFTLEDLQKSLDKFIEKYIICNKCKFPEQVMKIEDGRIRGLCKSCGNNVLLDNKHKMASYIVKNPPKNAVSSKTEKGKDGDASKNQTDKKESKKRKPDTLSDAPMRVFKTELKEKGYPLDINDPLIAKIKETYETCLAQARPEEAEDAKKANDKVHEKVVEKAYKNVKTLKIPREKQMIYGYLLFFSLFTKNIAKQVKKESKLILGFYSRSHRKPQMEHEMVILLAHLIYKKYSDTDYTKFIPTILHLFKEEGLLSKDFLLQWGVNNDKDAVLAQHFLFDRDANDKLKAAARPLLNTLTEADDDEEAEGEEEEDEEEEGGSDEGEEEEK